jgi:hypothetical protein
MLFAPDTDQPFGEAPLVRSLVGEKSRRRGQRVLDGLFGVRVGGGLEIIFGESETLSESDTISFEIRMSNAAMMIP